MGRLASDLAAQGRDIIALSQGEPDFDTPAHVCAAGIAAIESGQTRYTNVDGTPALKQAIIDKFKRENGLSYLPAEISVGTGGKQVIYNALLATLEAGDEVIIPAPYWVSYPDMVRLAGGSPVIVACPESDNFLLTADNLRASITSRTKMLLLNSPSNPTGAGYSAEQLKSLASVLLDYPDVLVLTDDMYEHLRFDDWQFSTMAAVEPRLKDRVLTCNGVSKAYSMTGWRIGYAGGPEDIIKAMSVLQSQSTSNPCSVSQAAAVAALSGSLDFLQERNQVFQDRRDYCVEQLNQIPGLSCRKPNGAFYLFPSCAGFIGMTRPDGKLIESDTDFVMWLIEDAGVVTVPGSAFGLSSYFRISFAVSDQKLEAACARIKVACEKLS
ncbi:MULTISPECIES: pyridoxal phosphate-dependent aminotransferase [unclassified Klebsiella]|uniref:pyridoxal phosphate-dependent aminotransferase n=1 Tax=unclassified Klebsiella TaxID=2608929 RepID=UPI001D0D7CA2|nr:MULTISPECIES: pyridoxal phosphate-dependent aminotransferase [unclassified Klebsiella]